MKNSGRVSVWGLLFIILIIAVIFGKASFWHIIFFPFYILGGILGFMLGIILLVLFIIAIIVVLNWIFG